MLFVQGSRDAFGTPTELAPVLAALTPPTTLHVVEGGDHSFKVGTRDPARQTAVYDDVQHTIVEWICRRSGRAGNRVRRSRNYTKSHQITAHCP